MKNAKILLPLMALSLTLVGCGNGENTSGATTTAEDTTAAASMEPEKTSDAIQSSESSESETSESAQTEQTSTDPYKINEVDYLLLKSNMCSPRVFLTSNFTFELNGSISKIDNGKFEGYAQGDRFASMRKSSDSLPSLKFRKAIR